MIMIYKLNCYFKTSRYFALQYSISTLHRYMQQLQPLRNSRDDVNMEVLGGILYDSGKCTLIHGGESNINSRILFKHVLFTSRVSAFLSACVEFLLPHQKLDVPLTNNTMPTG